MTASPDILAALTPAMLFDALAVRVDGPRAWDERLTIDVRLVDTAEVFRLRLANGVLTHSPFEQREAADLTLRLPRAALAVLASGASDTATLAAAGIEVDGDASVLGRLFAVLDRPDQPMQYVVELASNVPGG